MHVVKHSGCEGSHRGLGDWYDDLERGIVLALAQGPGFEWTTEWYASKHEIATACITCEAGELKIEASVSDDFDTPGYGCVKIPHTECRQEIDDAIYKAWDEASADKKENETYAGYAVIGPSDDSDREGWIETYLKPRGDGYMFDEPPGDYYYQWYWQGECDLDDDVKDKLAEWAEEHDEGEFAYKEYTIKPWSD